MDADSLRRAVGLAQGRVVLEASGNMRLARIAEVAATGADYVSVRLQPIRCPSWIWTWIFDTS